MSQNKKTEIKPEPTAAEPQQAAKAEESKETTTKRSIQQIVSTIIPTIQRAIDNGEIMYVGLTVIGDMGASRPTMGIFRTPPGEDASPEELRLHEEYKANAVFLAATEFGKAHVVYSQATIKNLNKSSEVGSNG